MNVIKTIFYKKNTKAGTKPAIIFNDCMISYNEVFNRIKNMAGGLAELGVSPGERVVLLILNRPENLISYFAVIATGATAIPINIHLKADEIKYILEDSTATTLIFSSSLYSNIQKIEKNISDIRYIEIGGNNLFNSYNYMTLIDRQVERFRIKEVNPNENAHIIYTTGTTGKPKGVLITHANLSWMAKSIAQEWEMEPGDKIVMPLPLFHVYGLICSIAMMIKGSVNILIERFRAEDVIESIMKHRPSGFMGVPTMYTMMLSQLGEDIKDMSFLKYCASGASSLPVEVLQSFREKFKANIIEGYGLSECTVSVAKNPLKGKRKPGSVGLPFPGVSVKILDENGKELPEGKIGEIVVKGPNVMKGYLNNPEMTKKTIRNGWLYTGDLGYKDGEGYLYISDRKKEMYIRGGENVYPREIEEVLYHHPAVYECAVCGIPDDVFGQEGKAFIVLKCGYKQNKDELINFCKERLAHFKVPKYFVFMDEFPKTATGKILKRNLNLQ
jgi:long-chain acyl-CoA synthetase